MRPSKALERRLAGRIADIPVVDVHSHVPSAAPCARTLRDLLGYHYFTELAHSAGMNAEVIAPDRPDEEMLPELLDAMENINNTVQYSWMMELARELFGFEDDRLTRDNWQPLDEAIRRAADDENRARAVLSRANIEKVFLTNSFDDDLEGIDTDLFVPALRLDDLVFGFQDESVRESLQRVTGVELAGGRSLAEALGRLVERFRVRGARSVAISLPPGFEVCQVDEAAFDRVAQNALRGARISQDVHVLQSGMLLKVAENCGHLGLCFQIMYGVVRGAYEHGVLQGTDLPVAGCSLSGLLPLLNGFPEVTFCLSVLSAGQLQELAAYGWLVQNVVLSGHWWYLNVPARIERDLAARLQSVPKNKLIGYYSDAYKVEFALAKFNMYRRILSRVLARDFVEAGFGAEEDAVRIASLLLRENPIRIMRL